MFNNSSDWDVIESPMVGGFKTKLYFIHRNATGVQLASIVKGQIRLKEIKDDGIEHPPTLELNYDLWRRLKEVMVNTKVREKSEVEAELGATKYHLEDLRKLVFKNNHDSISGTDTP